MNQRPQKPTTLQQRNNAKPMNPMSTVLPIGAIKGKEDSQFHNRKHSLEDIHISVVTNGSNQNYPGIIGNMNPHYRPPRANYY